jgi:hypothetical protein
VAGGKNHAFCRQKSERGREKSPQAIFSMKKLGGVDLQAGASGDLLKEQIGSDR